MPWCEPCEQYLAVPSVTTEGRCPRCGEAVAGGTVAGKVPWHFKLLVAATGAYLAMRGLQGLAWLGRALF